MCIIYIIYVYNVIIYNIYILRIDIIDFQTTWRSYYELDAISLTFKIIKIFVAPYYQR